MTIYLVRFFLLDFITIHFQNCRIKFSSTAVVPALMTGCFIICCKTKMRPILPLYLSPDIEVALGYPMGQYATKSQLKQGYQIKLVNGSFAAFLGWRQIVHIFHMEFAFCLLKLSEIRVVFMLR